MSLPFFIAIVTTILFGSIAIYFSIREQNLRKELRQREEIQKRRLYEISTLRAIQERIGYSLDIERVIDTITGSLKNLFPYSTASSLLIEPNKLVFKTAIEEEVSRTFIDEVKKSMVASLSALLNQPLPTYIEEIRTGTIPNDNNKQILSSFFHIPLVVNGNIVGLINVSSTKPGLYKDPDMTVLYQMTSIASNALSRLREVITTEEEKLLAMIGSLSDGVVFIDKNLELRVINTSAKLLLGLTHKDNISIADVLPILSHLFSVTDAVQQTIATKQSMEKNSMKLGDKLLRALILPVRSLQDGKEEVIGATITLQDITLATSLSNLKEDFTNGIVHELRSPLTAIKSGAELLLEDTTLTASQEKLLTIIDEQTKRMLSDINSLLDAAKIEAGKFSIQTAPQSLKPIFDSVIALFQAEADSKHIILQAEIPEDLPEANIDKAKIQQVLENLVANSMKFTSAGGTIKISVAKQFHEHLPQSPTNPGLVISVSDTGSGIPKDKQANLFSKFSQVGASPIPHAQQGTGLGLYISKGIVESHNGQIFLSSEEGKGTTVSFTLPINMTQGLSKKGATNQLLYTSLKNDKL